MKVLVDNIRRAENKEMKVREKKKLKQLESGVKQ